MAQDFYRLFNTGGDSLAISTIDPAGVALVGVQELKKENEDLKKTVSVQNDKLDRLEKELNEMKKKIDKTM
jgi:septal ring factor EnvC (AmiA/AmiB activator)